MKKEDVDKPELKHNNKVMVDDVWERKDVPNVKVLIQGVHENKCAIEVFKDAKHLHFCMSNPSFILQNHSLIYRKREKCGKCVVGRLDDIDLHSWKELDLYERSIKHDHCIHCGHKIEVK